LSSSSVVGKTDLPGHFLNLLSSGIVLERFFVHVSKNKGDGSIYENLAYMEVEK